MAVFTSYDTLVGPDSYTTSVDSSEAEGSGVEEVLCAAAAHVTGAGQDQTALAAAHGCRWQLCGPDAQGGQQVQVKG